MTSSGSGSVTAPVAASAVSGHLDTRTAAMEAAGDLYDHIGAGPDLVVIFASYQHRAALPEAAATFRSTLRPRTLLGVTAEAVLGVDQELDGVSGLSAIALRLPGASLHPFSYEAQRHAGLLRDPDAMRRHLGVDDSTRAILLLADPFSTPISRLLPAISGCRGADGAGMVPVAGGMASGASQAGNNMLVLDGATLKAGAVGAAIGGAVQIDIVVSQGCRPIGRPLVVTRCKGNVILELGARPATEALHEQVEGLGEADRALASAGVLIGTVIDEYKARFGRGDFLVRSILGLDQQKGAIAVGDTPRVGQTVQFHVRDADAADEDLRVLLGKVLKEGSAPQGALLFSCNGRGTRMFPRPHHDAGVVQQLAGPVPLAGFFAQGEIGPISGKNHLHGFTASLALFEAPPDGERRGA